MKKTLAVILAIIILAAFAGCGKNEPTVSVETPAPAETAKIEEPEVKEEQPAVQEAEPEEPAEEPVAEETVFDEEKYNIAVAYGQGEGMDGLIEKIGEPNSEDYTTGCSGHEEEGILYYNGFRIYTFRDGGYVTFDMAEKD